MIKQISIICFISLIILISGNFVFGFQISTSMISSTSTITETINQSVCSSLTNGNNDSSSDKNGLNCSLTGSSFDSPVFLTNLTSDLVIPLGQTFTLNKTGFGFAEYGEINNQGTLVISNPLIIYGILINSGTINITGDLILVNKTDSSSTTYLNNTGNIVINSFLNNGAIINNFASISNLGVFRNCIKGNNFSSQFNNNGVLTGNPIVSTC